jgi:hypothetical protein
MRGGVTSETGYSPTAASFAPGVMRKMAAGRISGVEARR